MLRLAVWVLFAWVVAASDEGEERLIGWQGETYKPAEYRHGNGSLISQQRVEPWIQTISWKPRAFIYHNFLSLHEARHIISQAQYQMKRSTVVGANNTGVTDNVRTSAGTFLRRNLDPVIKSIEKRLAVWTQLPPSHQEDMQVLRYGPTNKYGPHMDGLERVATVLIYLVEPEEGGETAFVDSEWAHPDIAAQQAGKLSQCAQGHVAYRPKRGDALMFYDLKPNYLEMDGHSTHTGCPVIKGVKWNAVKWIHGVPFRGEDYEKTLKEAPEPVPDPGLCYDSEERCKLWAESGECERNPGFMIGTGSSGGACRRSCNDCVDCAEGDDKCMDLNRKRGGFMVFDDAELKF